VLFLVNIDWARLAYANHSYDILGARMLWKPKEARILKNFIDQPV
jgi:hypothetical protein